MCELLTGMGIGAMVTALLLYAVGPAAAYVWAAVSGVITFLIAWAVTSLTNAMTDDDDYDWLDDDEEGR